MIEMIGYVGSMMMMLCGIPQLIKICKEGHAEGLSLGYLVMGQIGMISFIFYVALTTLSIPLLLNYVFNAIVFGIALRYKMRPQRKS